MTTTNNEIWLLALVDDQGNMSLGIPDPTDSSSSVPVPSPTLVVPEEDSIQVKVRLKVRSSSTGEYVPGWTSVSPATTQDGLGDFVSDLLELPKSGTLPLTIELKNGVGSASLTLRLAHGLAKGIRIVLRAPPVPPQPCIGGIDECLAA